MTITITPDILERHKHISTPEVEEDIRDTEQEIAVMEGEVKAFEMIPAGSADYRMAQFRASGRRDGIRKRQEFIEKLRALLAAREQFSGGL